MTTSDLLEDVLSDARDRIELLLEQEREQTSIERALADELALALGIWIKYGRPPVQAAEAMARYKAARGIEESRWDEVKERSDAALARHKERHDA
jgi:hypothetical protein